MSRRRPNPSNDFADFGRVDQRRRIQLKQLERIQKKLEEFLSPEEARATTIGIFNTALEVDEEIDRILRDPMIQKSYKYDGCFFTPKYGWGFYRAFDGIHMLCSLDDVTLDTFFRGRGRDRAIQWLMEGPGKHAWEAKVRRMNWEESGTLGIVLREVIDEILRLEALRTEEDTPLSPEQRTFFQSFEDQMANRI